MPPVTTIDGLVDRLYEAYNAQDAAAAAELYAPDGRHVEIATGGERTGPDAIREGLEGFLRSFPDAHWAPQERIVAGSAAAVTYVLTGTLQAKLGPFEPAGQRLELRGVHLVRERDGAIAACEDYWDAGSFGRQMKA